MPRADYQFEGPPVELGKLRGRLIGFSVGLVAYGAVFMAIGVSGVSASTPTWIIMTMPLVLMVGGILHTIRTIRERFPQTRNPEGIDRKTLPPLPPATGASSFTVTVRPRKIRLASSPVTKTVAIVIIVLSLAWWLNQRGLVPIFVGTGLIALWFSAVAIRGGLSVTEGDPEHIQIDEKAIRIPRFLLSYDSKRLIRKDSRDYLELKWDEISSWTSVAGDSEDPAIYEICASRGGKERRYEISRSSLRRREHELLDAVRRIGQLSVVLKDSLAE